MNNPYIPPFVDSVKDVFTALALGDISSGNSYTKESLMCRYNVIVIIGLSGTVKGNVVFSMDYGTAKRIVSAMMMGMEIADIDETAASALGELANMMCGQAVTRLLTYELSVDITPPTVIHGDRIKSIISQVETIAVEVNTALGAIELNIGLEI
jgi:chemotaxis protein CheX